MAARVNLSIIEAGLNTYLIGRSGTNELWDEIASTNDRAIELARQSAPEGGFVLARRQTGGRGRQGRSWLSPMDGGLFISFILRPTTDPSFLPIISFVGGVAAAEAIERVSGVRIGLKWVNDLVFEGKKVGGILAEVPGSLASTSRSDVAQSGPSGSYAERGNIVNSWILPPPVVLGIGINLALEDNDLPPELRGKVASLDHILKKPIDANDLVVELCSTLEDQFNHLRHSGPELVLAEWKQYTHTLGKRIKARLADEELEGFALDLAENGALIVRLDNGETRLLHAGEITIRLEDGKYA